MISLHTSPLAPLGRTRDAGGMNVYVRELSRELGRGGMYVDVFTRRSAPDLPLVHWINDHVRLVHIPAGPAEPLPPSELFPYVEEFAHRIMRFAEHTSHGYDMVHSHYWLSAAAGEALACSWDVPHVTMFHTVERLKGQQYGGLPTRSSALRIEQEARITAAVDRITVSTEHEREQLSTLYHIADSQIRLIPCGVDLSRFTPGSEAERCAVRKRLTPGGEPVLVFAGRLDPIKGIDLLLESIARMRMRAHLFVIGGDPAGDPEVERLKRHAVELGIADRIHFPGAMPQQELTAYYRAADAIVVTSRYESFGLVAVEALACGTPVVASAVGGLTSIVRDGENGLLVPERTSEAFAARLDYLLEHPETRTLLARNARRSVARFGWRRVGNEVRAMYQELTASQPDVAACSCF
jgi:D-inositol-3-phosphate glycosyltransferase